MKKTTSVLLSVLVTVLTLFFGSHTYTVESTGGESNSCVKQSIASTTPDFVPVNEEDEDDDAQEDFSQESIAAPQLINTSGIYIGQIDNNSVEISVDNKPMAFYLSDTIRATFTSGNFAKNTRVKLQYMRNSQGQNLLTRLEIEK